MTSTTTTINNPKLKSPIQIVHSIASGLKKGTKVLKKASEKTIGTTTSRRRRKEISSNNIRSNNVRNKAFGQHRRLLRRERKRTRCTGAGASAGAAIIEESESFSSPEREIGERFQLDSSLSTSRSSMVSSIEGVEHISSRSMKSSSCRHQDEGKESLQARVLNSLENLLRNVLAYIGVYLFGAYDTFSLLARETVFILWHYLLVIWGTCVFIKVLTYYVPLQTEEEAEEQGVINTAVNEDVMIIASEEEEAELVDPLYLEPIESIQVNVNDATLESIETIPHYTHFTEKEVDESDHSIESENNEGIEQDWSQVNTITRNDPPQNHSELEDIFIIDKMTNQRLIPNGEPVPIENELFSGNIMLMFRTSDADLKEAPIDTTGSVFNDVISDYFRGKKRRFDFQLQLKLKKIPVSPVLYLAFELEDPVKLGLVQRAFVKATLNFLKHKNPSFTFNISGNDNICEEDKAAGKYENPRLTFPAHSCLDRMVITKPGDVPPKLGGNIHEDPVTMVQRKKKGITYNLNDTYTFCIWSAYIDFPKWKVINLPAIRPFSIAPVNGAQPISLRIYTLNAPGEGHLQCNVNTALHIEFNNRQTTTIGEGLKKWIKLRQAEMETKLMTDHIENVTSNNFTLSDPGYDYAYSTDAEEVISYQVDMEVNADADSHSNSDLGLMDEIEVGQSFVPIVNKSLFAEPCDFFSPAEVKLYSIDTPAWIEMMHRKRRKLQRVYVVRMKKKNNDEHLKPSFHRLRTGAELSKLIRLGFELGFKRSQSMDGFSSIHGTKKQKRLKIQGDHHVAINKAIKKKLKQQSPTNLKSTQFKCFRDDNPRAAGTMKPADQSCITLSIILANLSNASKTSSNVAKSLSNEITPSSLLDSWFLRGSVDELGVVPAVVAKGEAVFGDFIVARCLWESHWKEEACIIYENRIEFYPPMTRRAKCTISFHDIKEIRLLSDEDGTSTLLLPQLVIETHWQCYYLSFCDVETRSNFHNLLSTFIFSNSPDLADEDEWQAHFWQGFHLMANASGSNSKWDKIVASKNQHQRLILNNRRMSFDCEKFPHVSSDDGNFSEISTFVEDLLKMSLSFTSENLETSTFIKFQEKTVRLKNLPLQKLDRSKVETFCVWINLYHCLLQHSLLLSSRAPTKKNISSFARTRCYEIGGDVFSLAEIECCILRGKMSKGLNVKAPFVREPKRSRAHYRYALHYNDSRINFVLNTGDKSKPRMVPVFQPNKVEEQLVIISTQFLRQNISIDCSKKLLTLPRICEVYRKDFGNVSDLINRSIIKYLDEEDKDSLVDLRSDGNIMVKYDQYPDRFYSSLSLLKT